jgi:hypothetical protein
VAALSQEFIYRDGGQDGEQITRRIFADLRDHLNPGGALYCTATLNELPGKNAEQRIRDMLGPSAEEFDVFVAVIVSYDPLDFFFSEARRGKGDFADLRRRQEVIERLQIERMIYASFVVRRMASPREPLTLRRQLSPQSRWQDAERLLEMELLLAPPAPVEHLLTARPRARTGLESKLVQKLEKGRWQIAKCEFQTLVPFFSELEAPPWTGVLLERMNGESTVAEHLQFLQEAGFAPPGADPSEFARFISVLARNGVVELPGLFGVTPKDGGGDG